MYLDHFKLHKAPFSLTPNTEFYCELPSHQEALQVLTLSLSEGEGFIKIIGEVGTGKTLLCRLLLNYLNANYITAYIPNPDMNADALRLSIASELGIVSEEAIPKHKLQDAINHQLLKLHQQGKKTALIIDEAQVLSESCLEAIRLLTNLETEEKKLLQVVLFAQPELDVRLSLNSLRQLRQRITFAYYLKPLEKQQLDIYLYHRLAKAGHTYGSLFTRGAKRKLFKYSHGLPRLLNILCHKGMLVAYGQGSSVVNAKAIKRAIHDTESALPKKWYLSANLTLIIISTMSIAAILSLYWKLGLLS